MNVLEYIFFLVFKKYQQWGEYHIPGVYAICFISVLQTLNVITILLIGLSVNMIDIHSIRNYVFALIYFFSLFFNYYYLYKIKGINRILYNLSKEGKSKTRLRVASFSYVILTVLVFIICLTIYIKK